jgi:hypothetical protein
MSKQRANINVTKEIGSQENLTTISPPLSPSQSEFRRK